MNTRNKIILTGLIALLFVGTGVFVLKSPTLFGKMEFDSKNKDVEAAAGFGNVLQMQEVFRSIAKSVMPAVVSITAESEQTIQNPYADMFNDPFFRRFFGEDPNGSNNGTAPRQYKQKMQALGSGFIITKDGYLFSNYHVVKNATKIYVVLADNRRLEAKVIGFDADTDVALLKINANNLPTVYMGDSADLQVGDFVFAIGNPFGLSQSFSFGIVSAIGRHGMTGFQRYIQTDAAVNPGNSGGPLVNIKGQVIGINAAIQSQTGGYQGISFAIPISTAKNIANQLLETGKVSRGYLGINIAEIDAPTRKSLNLSDNEGVMVSKVEKNSPAEKAGVKNGDIVTKVAGNPISAPEDLQAQVGNTPPKTQIQLELLRNKKRTTVTVTLSERPANPGGSASSAPQEAAPSSEVFEFSGAQFSDATADVLKQNGAEFGVVVNAVKQDSPFADALEAGSIVVSINDTDIHNLKDLKAFAAKNKNTKAYTFLIVKDGYTFYRGIDNN